MSSGYHHRFLALFCSLILFSSCDQSEAISPPVEDRAYLTVKTEALTPGESGTNSLTYSGTLRAAGVKSMLGPSPRTPVPRVDAWAARPPGRLVCLGVGLA